MRYYLKSLRQLQGRRLGEAMKDDGVGYSMFEFKSIPPTKQSLRVLAITSARSVTADCLIISIQQALREDARTMKFLQSAFFVGEKFGFILS